MKINEIVKYKTTRENPVKLTNNTIKNIVTNCSEAVLLAKQNKFIYRGIRSIDSDIVHVEPSKFIRRSANTSNYYTMIIDSLPEWSMFPKRSQSIICSTNCEYARGYGGGYSYVVLPVNGNKWGICPDNDIWGTKLYNIHIVKLNKIFDKYHLPDNNFAEFILELKKRYIDRWMREHFANELSNEESQFDDPVEAAPTAWNNCNGDVLKFISELYNPTQAGFKIGTISTILNNDFDDNEVWTNGESYLVQEDSQFLQEIINYK
jgi:hypothetical protein